jgi:hypothetical protein
MFFETLLNPLFSISIIRREIREKEEEEVGAGDLSFKEKEKETAEKRS